MTRVVGGVVMEPGWQGKPKEPLRDMLRWLTGESPPKFVTGYDYSNLTDEQHMQLQEWAVSTLDATPVWWGTGIGIVEAAEKLVIEAVSNGNIPGKDSSWRSEGLPATYFEPRRLVLARARKKRVATRNKKSKKRKVRR